MSERAWCKTCGGPLGTKGKCARCAADPVAAGVIDRLNIELGLSGTERQELVEFLGERKARDAR